MSLFSSKEEKIDFHIFSARGSWALRQNVVETRMISKGKVRATMVVLGTFILSSCVLNRRKEVDGPSNPYYIDGKFLVDLFSPRIGLRLLKNP